MSSRIEQIIEEIEDYLDNCKYQPFSSTKIIVDKEEISYGKEELSLVYKSNLEESFKEREKISLANGAAVTDPKSELLSASSTMTRTATCGSSIGANPINDPICVSLDTTPFL